jgi:hypothetical protein
MPPRISDTFGIKKTKQLIKIIHRGEFPGVKKLMWDCLVSEQTLFRHMNEARDIFEMSIRFQVSEPRGYYIEDYGIIDKSKL